MFKLKGKTPIHKDRAYGIAYALLGTCSLALAGTDAAIVTFSDRGQSWHYVLSVIWLAIAANQLMVARLYLTDDEKEVDPSVEFPIIIEEGPGR